MTVRFGAGWEGLAHLLISIGLVRCNSETATNFCSGSRISWIKRDRREVGKVLLQKTKKLNSTKEDKQK